MALTKVGKEGVTGISNSSNATAITIDSSERVGIGAAPNATFGSLLYTQGTPAANKPIISGYSQGNSSNAGIALFNDAGNRGIWTTGSTMRFTRTYEGNSTADVTIDASGHVGIGTTTLTGSGTPDETDNGTGIRLLSNGFIGIGRDAGICGQFNRNNAGAILGFRRAGGEVGTISVSNTATAYNTSSDYRLKENVDYTWDATTRLKQLKPARFNFIADADTTVDGFLANEVSSIIPEAISGTKDAVEVWTEPVLDADGNIISGEALPDGVSAGDNKLDADGNTIPVYQGIDQSKIVPLLTKALIESVEKIEQLEARITALEDA